jgi:hydrogenase/urease accessory protein HupE
MMRGANDSAARRCRRAWLVGALTLVCWAASSAVAHKGGTTGYATLSISGQTVRYALTLPGEGVLPGGPARDLRDFSAAIARHLVISADGVACAGVPQEGRPLAAEQANIQANIEVIVLYACRAPILNLSIRYGLDALLGNEHHTITDIQWPGGGQQVVFESERRDATIALTGSPQPDSQAANAFAFSFGIGVEHILLGFDHVLLIVVLILPGGSLLSLIALITAFTVAHSITLTLSALGLVTVPAQIVEPVIALSIASLAIANLAGRNTLSRRWAVSFLIGLVHGFGFAGGLAEVGLPTGGLVAALVGFNLGVEAGQALIVAALLPLLIWSQRFSWEPVVQRLSSIAIMAAGLYLLAERTLIGNA